MWMAGWEVKRSKSRFKACNSSGNKGRGEEGAAADRRDLQGERDGVGWVRILSRKEAQGSWSLRGEWWNLWGPQQVHVMLQRTPLNNALSSISPEEEDKTGIL